MSRVHYSNRDRITWCGNPHADNWTVDPAKVTCGNCKRLLEKEVK